MPKTKSSASSATKKKHARKAAAKDEKDKLRAAAEEEDASQDLIQGQEEAGDDGEHRESRPIEATSQALPAAVVESVKQKARKPEQESSTKPMTEPQKLQRGQKKQKQSKKHRKGEAPPPPRRKQYIPPPKPPRGQLDPVDIYGLGVTGGFERVPAEKVVTLRLLNKKDESSIERAMEDLISWVKTADDEVVQQIVEAIPVWIHHVPRLLSHSSRRVRVHAANLNALFLTAGPRALLGESLPTLVASASPDHPEFLPSIFSSAFDPDRQVRTTASANWQVMREHISLDESLESLFDALTSTIQEEAEAIHRSADGHYDANAPREELERIANHLSSSIDAFTYLLNQCHHEQECYCERLLSSPLFWALLSSIEWPLIRRATWRTLARMLAITAMLPILKDNLRIISSAALHAAWSERDFGTQDTMWPVLVDLLQAFPRAWYTLSPDQRDYSSSSASSDSDEASSQSSASVLEGVARGQRSMLAGHFQSYLDLLQLGFFGNASTGYKYMSTMLRTIPKNYLIASGESLQHFYTSFWAAYTSRALFSSGPAGLVAFVSACVHSVELVLTESKEEHLQSIAIEQLLLLWQYYIGSLPSPSRTTSLSRVDSMPVVQQGFTQAARDAPSLFKPLQEQLQRSAMLAAEQSTPSPSLFAATTASFCKSPATEIKDLGLATERMIIEAAVKDNLILPLTNIMIALLDQRGEALFDSATNCDALDRYILTAELSQYAFMERYLRHRSNADAVAKAWQYVVSLVRAAVQQTDLGALLPLTESFVSKRLHAERFHIAELDELLLGEVRDLITGSATLASAPLQSIKNLIVSPHPFVHNSWKATVTSTAEATTRQSVDALYTNTFDEVQVTGRLLRSMQILNTLPASDIYGASVEVPLFVTIFEVAFLLPKVRVGLLDIPTLASNLWHRLISDTASLGLDNVAVAVAARFGALLRETEMDCFHLVASLSELEALPGVERSHLWDAFLPERHVLDDLLAEAIQTPTHPALYITKDLVNPSPGEAQHRSRNTSNVSYTRAVLSWSILLGRDRAMANQHIWFSAHVLLLQELLRDDEALQGSTLLSRTEQAALQAVLHRLSSYLMLQAAAECDSTWHEATISACKAANKQVPTQLMAVFVNMLQHLQAAKPSMSLAGRVLAQLMALLVRYSDMQVEDAERWLTFAKSIRSTNSAGCLAIVLAVKPLLLDSLHFHRYQSQVASDISGIKPINIAAEGIYLLRLFAALAPPYDSEQEALPVNRAIFLMQSLQKWIPDDNTSLDEDHYAPLLDVFTALIPTLQNTLSSMWFTMFDLVEESIDLTDWQNLATLPGIWAACRFMQEVKRFRESNKALRAHTLSSFTRIVGLLENQFASLAQAKLTIPTNAVLELVSSIVFEDSSLDPSSLSKLYPLLAHPDTKIQMTTFIAARRLITNLTEERSMLLATASGSLDAPSLSIDQSLLDVLLAQTATEVADSGHYIAKLLGWLLLFHHFHSASVALKTAFTEQLRSSGIIAATFMPAVLQILDVSDYQGSSDLSQWSVDEFDFEVARESPITSLNTTALASYTYYQSLRAIPALIRQTWEGYRSKQLSNAVAQMTAKYFSPLLIATELSGLDSDGADKPSEAEDQMVTKVLRSINEVRATYNVDEQPLELSIRLPPDFPLSLVEVKEGRRIGVPEAHWRAWIMNVQLIINSQNGTIAEALQLFKTNATRHFEGVEACAICYSVIAAADRSMPTKHCRTCKNAFHPPCLWKWFQTSHSSSCPLCRALF